MEKVARDRSTEELLHLNVVMCGGSTRARKEIVRWGDTTDNSSDSRGRGDHSDFDGSSSDNVDVVKPERPESASASSAC